MDIEFITFLLAILGYLGLGGNTILASQGKYNRTWMLLVAPIIIVHVFFVWHFRYEWQFSQATRNGYVGFLLFHLALLFIIGAMTLGEVPAKFLIIVSFLIVSAGALGAVFIYEVVAIYRYPVIVIFLIGLGFILKAAQKKYLGN